MKREEAERNKIQEKQVMHNIIVHHPLTDAPGQLYLVNRIQYDVFFA